MFCKTIQLLENDPQITLTAYVHDTKQTAQDALLIIPGGGYSFVSHDREGEPIALKFSTLGMMCFELNYSVKERSKQPQTLAEASLAMAYIREHAEEYNVNPDRVFVVGFSAGGHLAGMLGTQWHSDALKDVIDIPEGSNRPTGMILCYPVLSYFPKTHMGTFNNAFGTDSPTEEQIKFCSVEKNVSELTCPTFLMHTADDTAVNVGNTLKMAVALEENNIPFEVHIYPHGPHGIALANEITAAREGQYDERIARWPELAREWMKRI